MKKITLLNGLIYRFFRVWYKMGHMKKAVSWAPATSAIRTSRCLCPWSFIWLLSLMPTCSTVQRRYLYFQRLLPKLEAVWSAQRWLWRGRPCLCHDHSEVVCTMLLWHLPKPQQCSLPDSQGQSSLVYMKDTLVHSSQSAPAPPPDPRVGLESLPVTCLPL